MAVIKKSIGERIFDIFNICLMIILSMLFIYPFWHQICVSLSDPNVVARGGLFLTIKGFNFSAYELVLSSEEIRQGYMNTIFVTVVGTALNVFFTAIMAYPLSKKTLPGRSIITFFVVFTMFFSGGMIPTYLVVRATGLLNSLWACIIPGLIGAYHVVITRNFFSSIPDELEEAAKIDGASGFYIFARIIVPLSMPVIATVALWNAVGHWNDYFSSLIYISDRRKYQLQMVLKEIIESSSPEEMIGMGYQRSGNETRHVVPETVKAASIMVSTIPILISYPMVQKHFVKGILIGSLKG